MMTDKHIHLGTLERTITNHTLERMNLAGTVDIIAAHLLSIQDQKVKAKSANLQMENVILT